VLNVNERLVASTILETLGRNGSSDVEDLYKSMQKLYGGLERRSFDETLMQLEIQGLIHVYNMAREKRRIELARG